MSGYNETAEVRFARQRPTLPTGGQIECERRVGRAWRLSPRLSMGLMTMGNAVQNRVGLISGGSGGRRRYYPAEMCVPSGSGPTRMEYDA